MKPWASGPIELRNHAIVDALYTKGIDLRDIRNEINTLSKIRNSIVHSGTGSEKFLKVV